jgi:hypothetical protein
MTRDEEIELALLEYLSEHPDAADTLEGIVDFWMSRHHVRVSAQAVSQALNRLVARNQVVVGGSLDRPLYWLNRSQSKM